MEIPFGRSAKQFAIARMARLYPAYWGLCPHLRPDHGGEPIGVERRWAPLVVLSVVCFALFAGTLFNELVFPSVPGENAISFAQRVADNANDVHDQIAFLSGFEILGNHYIVAKNLESTFITSKGKYNPASYSIRTETLLPDISGVGTGGIRHGLVLFLVAMVIAYARLSKRRRLAVTEAFWAGSR